MFKLHSRGNDRERITRAHQAAEALFASKPPINEPAAPDSANQSVLAISPTVPVRHDELGTSVNREPQTKHGIARSQFARIRALIKYGMTVSQVAEVYGAAVGEIERILRKA